MRVQNQNHFQYSNTDTRYLKKRSKPPKWQHDVNFFWQHGGKEVFVAYSGDSWRHKYRMRRCHGGFMTSISIKPGRYHYKFLVDDQWRCAPEQKYVVHPNGDCVNVLEISSAENMGIQPLARQICWDCKLEKTTMDFSKTQWSKKGRCKMCVKRAGGCFMVNAKKVPAPK